MSSRPSRALNILVLAPHPEGKGPLPKHTPVLVDSMRRLGCEVTLRTWGHRADQESFVRKLWDRAGDVVRIRQVAAQGHFDVIVVKTGHDWKTLTRDIPLLLATRGKAAKQVIQFHGSSPEVLLRPGRRTFKAASRFLVSRCDAIMVLSTEEARDWGRFCGQRDIYVVANPMVQRQVEGQAESDRSSSPPSGVESHTILFVGRLTRAKGLYELMDAVHLLRSKHPDLPWRLVIAGEGPDSAPLHLLAQDLGLNGRVEFPGYVEGGRLDALYRSSSLFVLPSYSEGFPTVITEAMAAGLPIVATGIRGIVDHLEEGVNALFVEPRDSLGLYLALERLLRDEELRRTMSAANREKVKVFEPDAVGSQYVSTLTTILSKADRT
jgi:glycosyltransferase involved in cell wall biosynthesis